MVSVNFILLLLILPPILMMSVLVDRKMRLLLLFLVVGMVAAFLSGQVNSVIGSLTGLSSFYISIHISPIVEELLKAFPVVLCLVAFRPKKRYIIGYAVAAGLGFAFFENAWAFAQSVSVVPGWEDIAFALSRGFGASMVHSLCTVILVYGIYHCLYVRKLMFTGPLALFSLVTIFHSMFNVLIQSKYTLAPFLLTLGTYAVLIALFRRQKKKSAEDAKRDL